MMHRIAAACLSRSGAVAVAVAATTGLLDMGSRNSKNDAVAHAEAAAEQNWNTRKEKGQGVKPVETKAENPNESQKQQQQAAPLPKCGEWCTSNLSSPCYIDETIVPCRPPYCKTTCSLWSRFALGSDSQSRPLSCADYKAGIAYARGGEVCDPNCLIAEVGARRYPLPAGLGVMCRPGTCSPAGCPGEIAKEGKALASLECPCNWFGSECDDDWVPVLEVRKGRPCGHVEETTLVIDRDEWRKVVRDHVPGSVVRLARRDSGGVARDMAAALTEPDTPGELRILTAPPDPSLRPEVRHVVEKVRAMDSGPVETGKLFVNPVISGFFNKHWTFLMDLLKQKEAGVEHVVICCTGAAMAGALSAVEAISKQNERCVKEGGNAQLLPKVQVHLYYGVRNIEHIPMRQQLEKMVVTRHCDLTILVSGNRAQSVSQPSTTSDFVHAAAKKGSTIQSCTAHPTPEEKVVLDGSKSVYVQHAVGLDLLPGGNLEKAGVTLENTAFVLCGRAEILDEASSVIDQLCRITTGSVDDGICEKIAAQLTFTNI